jgi:hypothetical protein
MDVFINDSQLNESLILPAGDKVFYVGYNLPAYSGADVEISEITIDGIQK